MPDVVDLTQEGLELAEPVGRLLPPGLDLDVEVAAQIRQPLERRFPGATIDGRWVRLAAFPEGTQAPDLLQAIIAVEPGLAQPRWQPGVDGKEISVLGAVVAPRRPISSCTFFRSSWRRCS